MDRSEAERRDAIEAALRASERRWRTVVTGAPVVLFALDPDGVFTLSEGRGLEAIGLQPGQVVGRSVFDVYAESEAVCDGARRALAGESLHQEVEVAGLVWDLRYSPVRDADGRVTEAIGVATNITEQRRLERRVQERRRLESVGILAGGIAHTFNNLLTAILGNTALALTRLAADHEARRWLERAEAAGRRAAEITSHILAFSERGAFAVEPLDLGAVVDALRFELEAAAPPTVHLHWERPRSLPPIAADEGRMRQVVRHLVHNACEACTETSGIVKIRLGVRDVEPEALEACLRSDACRPGPYVALEVNDNGCGMDARTRGRVFDPFFSTKGHGRGLGLAAVLGIIRGHGGAVRLDTAVGVGTTVEALFPLGARESGVREDAVAASPVDGAGRHALVVDDEEAIRDVAGLALEFAGWEVLQADSGERALQVFEEHGDGIALVLLDLNMPTLSGEETYRALRAKSGSLPIILMSGDAGDEAMAELAADDGPHAFLQKPFRPSDLEESLSAILR